MLSIVDTQKTFMYFEIKVPDEKKAARIVLQNYKPLFISQDFHLPYGLSKLSYLFLKVR